MAEQSLRVSGSGRVNAEERALPIMKIGNALIF